MNENEKGIIFLKGKRINLRIITTDDAEDFVQWMNDAEIAQYLMSHTPMTLSQEKEWVEKLYDDRKRIVLGIETKDGKLIGNMGLHGIDHIDRTATTGAVIGDREYWGKGYGSEAKMLLLNYAFNTLNLRKIKSEVYAFNERSVAYSLKCGYVIEGKLKDEKYRNGQYWNIVQLAVFKEDWLPVWEEYQKTGKLVSSDG